MSLSTQVYLAFCLVLFLYNLRFKDQTYFKRFKATIIEKKWSLFILYIKLSSWTCTWQGWGRGKISARVRDLLYVLCVCVTAKGTCPCDSQDPQSGLRFQWRWGKTVVTIYLVTGKYTLISFESNGPLKRVIQMCLNVVIFWV